MTSRPFFKALLLTPLFALLFASGCDQTVTSTSGTPSVDEVAQPTEQPVGVADVSLRGGGSVAQETSPLGIEDDIDLKEGAPQGSSPLLLAAAPAALQDAPPLPVPDIDLGLPESDPAAVAVIDRYVEAIGGLEVLKGINDRVERFNNKKLAPTGETIMKMARFMKRPVMIREDWQLPGMGLTQNNEPLHFVQVYDGEKAWVKAMGAVSPLAGKTLTVFVWDKHIDNFFATYQDNGYSARSVRKAEVLGRPVDIVEIVSFAGNQRVNYAFSEEDGLLLRKSWSEGTPPTVISKEVFFDDYSKIRFRDDPEKWIRAATSQKIFEDGELSLEKTYTEIVLNGGLPSSTFARPDGRSFEEVQRERRAQAAKKQAGEGSASPVAGEGKPVWEKPKPVWEKPKPKPKPIPKPKPKPDPPVGGTPVPIPVTGGSGGGG